VAEALSSGEYSMPHGEYEEIEPAGILCDAAKVVAALALRMRFFDSLALF